MSPKYSVKPRHYLLSGRTATRAARPVLLVLLALPWAAAGCGAAGSVPLRAAGAPALEPDRSRLAKRCDPGLQVCRYSVLPDLRESRAGYLSLLGVLIAPSEGITTSVALKLGFQVTSNEARYRHCLDLAVRVDGAVLPRRPVDYRAVEGRQVAVEGILVPLSIAELLRITRATRVRYELCGDGRILRPEEQVLLAALFDMWRQG